MDLLQVKNIFMSEFVYNKCKDDRLNENCFVKIYPTELDPPNLQSLKSRSIYYDRVLVLNSPNIT